MVWGLHLIDLAILAGFLVAILAIGVVVSRGVRQESDFYLGGRTLGRVLQFFLNFGNSTDSTGAVLIASEVYRQGVGGLWIGFQTLFITPFFWFTQPWFRRARLVTMADLFVDRFDSKALALAYAAFNIFIALFIMGMGNVVAFKVASAMMVKPESAYTGQERRQVELFGEYQTLRAQVEAGTLPRQSQERFDVLDNLNKRGELRSFISYIKPLPFYLGYSAIVGIYIILGGLRAAAITDTIQGLLILVMSVLLIPLGLHRVGGLHGLHQSVAEYRFHLFGSVAMSEYTWYSIFAIFFTSLVQIIGLMHNMTSAGSARDENTARFGMISGGFTKRFVLIAWMLAGLLALGLFPGGLADPDNTWGALSKDLLMPGLMGLMLSGMLLGHMPAVGVSAVSVSALVTRNIYEPLVRGRSEAHYLRVGQWAVAGVLVLAVVFAMIFSGVVSMMTMLITFNTFFGAAVFLIFFWRRLTAAAIMVGLAIWVVMIGLAPWTLPHLRWVRRQPALLLQTPERMVTVTAGATASDVGAGRASRIGQAIRVPHLLLPRALFFERVARVDPQDPNSGMEGIGRFDVENYSIHLLGVPVRKFTAAGLVASRWLFDGLFPFVLLIAFSFVTRRGDLRRADRFYAKMRTPVAPTPIRDEEEVRLSHERPHRFDHLKLMPNSEWQFTKWTRTDFVGFFGCWGLVGVVLLVLWAVLTIGS